MWSIRMPQLQHQKTGCGKVNDSFVLRVHTRGREETEKTAVSARASIRGAQFVSVCCFVH